LSNLDKNKSAGFCCLIFVVVAMILIIGSSFPNARSLLLQNKDKSTYTSLVPGSKNVVGNGGNVVANSSNKVVMINFDDGRKSQVIYAKPILDKYGFKASFFIICGRVGTERSSLNWQDIAALQKDGMDIESHSMTHVNLNRLSTKALKYEIGGSKQCFANHGYNTTIFGYPFNLGSNKPSIVNLVAKHYDFGRSGSDRLMFLDCRGYKKDTQTDCRTYSVNGKLTHANRYDIRSASFFHVNNKHNFTPPEMFEVFRQIVNGQAPYNSNGKVNAIPVIVYHNITSSLEDYSIPSHAATTTLDLFAQEMEYLYDNGFKVLLLNQLGYDPDNNLFYIKHF
jgi:peptidoglycan/xylan/chitin deacetylase (PgdA/CDA1 family)